jgi:hypothetical protein
MGRVRRRTSTKQRSITLVVRQFAPQVPGKSEERQQFRQVLLQPADHSGVSSAPARAEGAKGGFCMRSALGQIDRLGSGFHFVVIAFPRLL